MAVVGGGIAGLAATFSLLERARAHSTPIAVDLFESEERFGGHLWTVRDEGFLIEGGPDCFVSQKPGGVRLAERLGISESVVDTRQGGGRTYVVSGGRPHALPDGVMLMIPTKFWPLAVSGLLSWKGKSRMGLDLVLPRGGGGDETLGTFVRRRLGDEALELIAEPLVAGVHAGDPDRLSLASTFPRFKRMEEEHRSLIVAMLRARRRAAKAAGNSRRSAFITLEEGVGQFVRDLVARLEEAPEIDLRSGVRIGRVERAPEGGWRLAAAGGDAPAGAPGAVALAAAPSVAAAHPADAARDAAAPYDAVVLAVPAYVAAELLAGAAPELSAVLGDIEAVSAATVSLGYRRDQVAHPLSGFGMVVPRREGRPIMGVTFSSEKFSGRAPEGHVLFRAFVGGVKGTAQLELGDEELVSLVRGQVGELLGVSGEPRVSRVFRWPRAMPQYNVGHADRLARIDSLVTEQPGLEVIGGSYRGIGIPDCVADAERAAEALLPE